MRTRRKARENSLIALYRWDIRGESLDKIIEELVEEKEIKNKDMLEYMNKLLHAVKDNLMEIDSLIAEYSEDWTFDRLGYIERNTLRLGTAELLYIKPVQVGRVFSDYIDIVKRYADKKAAKFVNGLLSRIYKDRRAVTSSAKKVS